MYAVVGFDGVVYGPVGVAILLQWIALGRIAPTSVLIDWQGRHLPASSVPELQGAFAPAQVVAFGPPPKSKRTALWLAFLLGSFGGHRFYLGHTATGFAMLALGIVTLGLGSSLWSVVDMVLISQGFLCEANGRPLA